jgi:hypothetical protein
VLGENMLPMCKVANQIVGQTNVEMDAAEVMRVCNLAGESACKGEGMQTGHMLRGEDICNIEQYLRSEGLEIHGQLHEWASGEEPITGEAFKIETRP